MTSSRRPFLVALPTALLVVALALAQEPAAPAEQSASDAFDAQRADAVEFFERSVRPLLIAHCYECHSHTSGKQKGGLHVDSRAALLAGGDSGPALVPGDPDASLMIRALSHTDPDLSMPPKAKLAEHDAAVLSEWVRRGAFDPRDELALTPRASSDEIDFETEARNHWAFVPPRDVEPPAVERVSWIAGPIDRFVLAQLESKGLAPSPPAEAAALIRRVTFGLTGLPPSADDVARFVADPSDVAYEALVERLLASPHYGERQARAWLDLARYAESNGLDENLAMSNAWRYRDWVVRAFNDDLPYDEFLTQQLAGDLLPVPDDEARLADQLTATGFLVLGPKMLAEQDKPKLVMDVVDEQLDVLGKTFMGLTISCARCHDHKFDPFPTRDYYALAGIFKSTETLANIEFVSRWREVELASPARIAARDEHARALADARARLAREHVAIDTELARDWRARTAEWFVAGDAAAEHAWIVEAEAFARGNVIVDTRTWGSDECAIVRTGGPERPQFFEHDIAFARGGRHELLVRAAQQDARPVRLLLDGREIAAEALEQASGSWFPDGQTWRHVATIDVEPGTRVLRVERDGDLPHVDAWMIVPTESLVARSSSMPAQDGATQAPSTAWTALATATLVRPAPHEMPLVALLQAARGHDARMSVTFAEHTRAHFVRLRDAGTLSPLLVGVCAEPVPATFAELSARHRAAFAVIERAIERAAAQPNVGADPAPAAALDPEQELVRHFFFGERSAFVPTKSLREAHLSHAQRERIAGATHDVARLEAAAPAAIDRALGVADGAVTEVPVHVRGNHQNLASTPVPRGFPGVLTCNVPAPPLPSETSGRLELARWLTTPRHPLTARVIVNRVWQSHFGNGLVRSPSNFGLRGDLPSHPELLDWLALELERNAWSLKWLHRAILSSSTYRQAVQRDPRAEALDPENRWLSRQNRRRLEAEMVRDGVLAVAGTLDRTLFGSLMSAKNGEYVTSDQSIEAIQYDHARRTLYLPVVRNALYDLLSTFDYSDAGMPVEQRSTTTDASQALWMMNSPLVIQNALAFARSLLAEVAPAETTLTQTMPNEATPHDVARNADAQRIDSAWRRAYGRPARADERERALQFVDALERDLSTASASADGPTPREGAWQALCQALFASNEFLHLD